MDLSPQPPTADAPPAAPPAPPSATGRGNATAMLIFALAALASLLMPWAAYSGESGDLSWSGTDLSRMPAGFSDRIDGVATGIHVLEGAGAVLAVVSLLRLLSPAIRLARFALVAALATVGGALDAMTKLHGLLSGGGPFAPSMQAGAVLAVVAAAFAGIAAIRGVVVQQRLGRPAT